MSFNSTQSPESQVFAAMLISLTATIGGGVVGGATNSINGAVSPVYFRNIMHWQNVEQIWRASIAQGVFEGLLYGTLFALVYTPVVILFWSDEHSLFLAFRSLLAAMIAICCCWVFGGLMAMGLATVSPEFYRSTFIGVPADFGEMLCYAWVGGSIWGALFGGVLTALIASFLFYLRWRKRPLEFDV